jgi:hypothetical protein
MQAIQNHVTSSVIGIVSATFSLLSRRRNASTPHQSGRPADVAPGRVSAGRSDRLGRLLWQPRQREIDAARASAKNVFDVEAKLRAIERPIPTPYY